VISIFWRIFTAAKKTENDFFSMEKQGVHRNKYGKLLLAVVQYLLMPLYFCLNGLLAQGGVQELAPTVEKSAVVCEGRLCKVGKVGLAKSSSSFQVSLYRSCRYESYPNVLAGCLFM
jgi:hypothetical protein